MIKNFAYKGLDVFFVKGGKAGIQPAHSARLRRQLAQLDQAAAPRDVNLPGWNLPFLVVQDPEGPKP